MEVTLFQSIQLENHQNGVITISKTFNTSMIPRQGDIVVDSLWETDDEQIVHSVEFNFQDDNCYVYITKKILPTNDKSMLIKFSNLAISHDWESNSFDL
jgi:hypothetical protein